MGLNIQASPTFTIKHLYMIQARRVTLIPFNGAHYNAIFTGNNIQLGTLLNIKTPDNWTEFPAAIEALQTLHEIFISLENDTRWGSYFIISENDRALVGTCGFKGKPGIENCVEIGYEIQSAYQNNGFATEVAKALVDFAILHEVKCVKAHTLPLGNASVAVLKKCGFHFNGEVNDPEDGLIWLWVLLTNED